MDHRDHVRLLREGVPEGAGVWADFGSGAGAFTLALADLLGPGASIHSVDKNGRSLRRQQQRMAWRFPGTSVHYHQHDYKEPLVLPSLDGLVMANSLHFHRDKGAVVRLLSRYMRPGGRFVIVEYNTDHGNRWVPYPLSFERWRTVAEANGLRDTRLLATQPSRFLGQFFAAVSFRNMETQ